VVAQAAHNPLPAVAAAKAAKVAGRGFQIAGIYHNPSAANLHKVEPLSIFEGRDAHEAHDTQEAQEDHEAHNAPLTTPVARRRQPTLKMNGSWPPQPLKTLLV